jgi:hypothetical protein
LATYVPADIVVAEDLQWEIGALEGPPLRILVRTRSCPAVNASCHVADALTTPNIFRRLITVNLLGAFNMMRLGAARIAALPPSVDGQRGVLHKDGLDGGVR